MRLHPVLFGRLSMYFNLDVLSAALESVAIFLRILFNQIMMELIVLKKENGVKGSEED